MVGGLTAACAFAGRLARSSQAKITVPTTPTRPSAGTPIRFSVGFARHRGVRSCLSSDRATLVVVDLGQMLYGTGFVPMNILCAIRAFDKGEG